MNRYVLLEHKVEKNNSLDMHYDFLLEKDLYCLTWKLLEIPKVDGSFIEIIQQKNHRLIWLTRDQYILSRNRGTVKQIDSGTYKVINNIFFIDNFSLLIKGKLLNGIFKKRENLCQLCASN